MTKTEMLQALKKRATLIPITTTKEDIVIRIYIEDDDYDEFIKWIKKKEKQK